MLPDDDSLSGSTRNCTWPSSRATTAANEIAATPQNGDDMENVDEDMASDVCVNPRTDEGLANESHLHEPVWRTRSLKDTCEKLGVALSVRAPSEYVRDLTVL